MAKKTKEAEAAPEAAVETKGNTQLGQQAKERAARAQNDVFMRNFKDGKPVPPNGKIPPQAQCIINVIEAAGKEGLTRADLVKNLKGVLVTRQPEGRILSYYQKDIQSCGAVTLKTA